MKSEILKGLGLEDEKLRQYNDETSVIKALRYFLASCDPVVDD
jgi:hypothetical protein